MPVTQTRNKYETRIQYLLALYKFALTIKNKDIVFNPKKITGQILRKLIWNKISQWKYLKCYTITLNYNRLCEWFPIGK